MLQVIRRELVHYVARPRRVLFDHLPKCAGTAVTAYLREHYPERLVFQTHINRPQESVDFFRQLPEHVRHRYRLITGHFTHQLLDDVGPDVLAVTILRDPVDRIVSHYFFVKEDKGHYLRKRVMEENVQLEDYPSIDCDELQNWYTTHFTGLSQDEVERDPDEAVRQAFDVISQRYDVVGFQDDLPRVMQQLQSAANFKVPYRGSVVNKTRHRPHVKEIPPPARQAIADANAADIELYSRLRAAMISDAVHTA